MKKLVHLLIVAILFSWSATIMAQCPPPDNSAGVNEFTTQTEIDNLIIDYPNCTELSVYVNIYDEENTTDPITNLNGLANLERIDGGLKVFNTTQLTDLTGLNGLTEVVRMTTIHDNTGLESLNGLQSLTTLNANASSVVYLRVRNNSVLTDITALQNVTSLNGGDLRIQENAILSDLNGIGNIDAASIDDLRITDNPSLSVCTYESVCNFISGGGDAEISGNAPGCADLMEVTANCSVAFPDCPESDVTLTTQAEVDQFLVDYPNCAVIPGTLIIDDAGTDPIVNFDGLQNIQTVYGLTVQNTTLTDVSFLSGFTTIAGSISFTNNAALTDISALSSFEEIDGSIEVTNNDALTTLSGLDNILVNTITNLVIENNDTLSLCNMDAICIYLAAGFPATISGNDTGCATIPEVEGTCDTAVCPPGDIELVGQDELDYFALQYPNCTQINGYLKIKDTGASGYVTNLQPLQNITTINGTLNIGGIKITDFNGLNNLQTVNGSLIINRNDSITNMQGFDSLETVLGGLTVYYNDNLENFIGMESLTTIGYLTLLDNDSLLNVDGLNNIGDLTNPNNLGGVPSIRIVNNESIKNVDALTGVTFTRHYVDIRSNPALESLSGLQNLITIGTTEPGFWDDLKIRFNNSLTDVGLESLETIHGKLEISGNGALTNLDGLSSLQSTYNIQILGNASLENITGLSNVTNANSPGPDPGISRFQINGNAVLTSLAGLENISEVGRLEIKDNESLTSYEGLIGLERLGTDLDLRNNPLITDMSGFENLTEIGANPGNGGTYFLIWDHASLTNVEAFNSLISLNVLSFGGALLVSGNPQLTSLSGLDNVDSNTINHVQLLDSPNLSYCEVASVCDFIATASASQVNIGNNATGCNTATEVEVACEALGLEDINLDSSITLHPNPMQETLTVSTTNGIVVTAIKLYDTTGKLVISTSGEQQKINVANLSSGIYFIKIETNSGLYQQKLVK